MDSTIYIVCYLPVVSLVQVNGRRSITFQSVRPSLLAYVNGFSTTVPVIARDNRLTNIFLCLCHSHAPFARSRIPEFSIHVNCLPSFPAFEACAAAGSADVPSLPARTALFARVDTYDCGYVGYPCYAGGVCE